MITFIMTPVDGKMIYISTDQISHAVDDGIDCTIYLKDDRLTFIKMPGKQWDRLLQEMKATTINTENLTE